MVQVLHPVNSVNAMNSVSDYYDNIKPTMDEDVLTVIMCEATERVCCILNRLWLYLIPEQFTGYDSGIFMQHELAYLLNDIHQVFG